MSSGSPIDWGRAERVAVRIATRKDAAPGRHGDDNLQWDPPIEQIEQQIEDITGLRSAAGPATAQLIDRPQWIRANIASFQQMLAPLFERFAERQAATTGNRAMSSAMSSASRQIAGAELGALLGWMSTRVLGQYDLLVGRDRDLAARGGGGDVGASAGAGDGAVYLVGANLASVEHKYGFDPAEFRTWVLIHELTHRAQFTGVPWMREYFTGLVDESLRFADPDPQVLLAGLKDALRNPDDARQRVRENGVVGLIAGPDQRAVIARIGGLMSLLEGHGDVTMTRAAGDLVPHAERFARVLSERRKRANPLTRMVLRLTGMEAKLNQYAAGEQFIAAVEAAGDSRVVDLCWERPEQLPSLDEIRTPAMWLTRMGRQVA